MYCAAVRNIITTQKEVCSCNFHSICKICLSMTIIEMARYSQKNMAASRKVDVTKKWGYDGGSFPTPSPDPLPRPLPIQDSRRPS
jgi:hypothetical protein